MAVFFPSFENFKRQQIIESRKRLSFKEVLTKGSISNQGAYAVPTPDPTTSPTPTPSITPTISLTPTVTPTDTPPPSLTPTATTTLTPTITITNTPTYTPTNTQTPTITQTPTPSVTPTISITPTLSLTPTFTPTQTLTPTCTVTNTPTQSLTPTNTPTISITPSITVTPSNTPTQTPTITPTITLTPTNTNTPSNTPTITITPSITVTPTITNTPTRTLTPTISITPSITPTRTVTPTITQTVTPTQNNFNPQGQGRYFVNYLGSGKDVYVTVGYEISAIFDKDPGFNLATTNTLLSAIDRWGRILEGNVFALRTQGSTISNLYNQYSNPMDGNPNETLVIYISSYYDSVSNTLGAAGTTLTRRIGVSNTNQWDVPFTAGIIFNSYYTDLDVADTTANNRNTFYYTALHEIGHCLGIGTSWFALDSTTSPSILYRGYRVGAGDNSTNPLGLGASKNLFYTCSALGGTRSSSDYGSSTTIDGSTRYIGDGAFQAARDCCSSLIGRSAAVSAYNAAFNLSLTAIPIENGRGFGSIASHWDEGYNTDATYGSDNRNYYGNAFPGAPGLNDELMTPQSEEAYDQPLSRITLGSLLDLGYQVKDNLADTYQPLVFNIYLKGSGQPLDIGFYGNTYKVAGKVTSNSGKPITCKRGLTYTFKLNLGASHPIYIVTVEGQTGTPPASRVTAGVTGDGSGSGDLVWVISSGQATGNYYLQCGHHSSMSALIILE